MGVNLRSLSNRQKTRLIDALRHAYALSELLAELNLARSSYFYHRVRLLCPDKYAAVRVSITDILRTQLPLLWLLPDAGRTLTSAIPLFREGRAASHEAGTSDRLGRLYDQGLNVRRDEHTADRSYRAAAEQGHAAAHNGLGMLLHMHGRDDVIRDAALDLGKVGPTLTSVDYEKAYVWFNLAAAVGVVEAEDARARIELRMPSEHIARAQRYSREWRPRRVMNRGGD